MPLTEGQEDAIDLLLNNTSNPEESLNGYVGSLYEVRESLMILMDIDTNLDTAIDGVDDTFDKEAMYTAMLAALKLKAKTAAENLVTLLT